MEHGEAEWCLDVIDALYDHYFVGPAKTQQAKNVVNEKTQGSWLAADLESIKRGT